MEALVKTGRRRGRREGCSVAKAASQMISHVDPANWMIGTNTKTATRVVVARRAISNAHRSGLSPVQHEHCTDATRLAPPRSLWASRKTRPMTSGTRRGRASARCPIYPHQARTPVTANPAASIHQGMDPSERGWDRVRRHQKERRRDRHEHARKAPDTNSTARSAGATISGGQASHGLFSSHATIRRERCRR